MLRTGKHRDYDDHYVLYQAIMQRNIMTQKILYHTSYPIPYVNGIISVGFWVLQEGARRNQELSMFDCLGSSGSMLCGRGFPRKPFLP